MNYVRVCNEFDTAIPPNCINETYVQAYLIPPSNESEITLFLNGGFDVDSFEIGFGAVIALFIAGLAVNLIVSEIRKIR